MSDSNTLSNTDIEAELMAQVDDPDAWESPINVPPSNSPRPERYRQSHIIKLDPDVAEVFPDSESVNHALRALAGIIKHQEDKTAPQ
jgi:hypothetical protein